MRTIFILFFIFAAWIVMPTVSGAQVGKDATSPGQLAPVAVQGARMESCKASTKTEIALLFDRWNQSLQTGDPRKVVANYAGAFDPLCPPFQTNHVSRQPRRRITFLIIS